jgi:hypothetical protein
VTNDDSDEQRDPLLVRPYLLADSGAVRDDPSPQTWPSATTREVRSQRALDGADAPTAILTLKTGRRRVLVLAGAGTVVMLAAAAAGFAAFHADMRPASLPDLPGEALPAVAGPSSSAAVAGPAPVSLPPRHGGPAATVTSAGSASTSTAVPLSSASASAAGDIITAETASSEPELAAPEPPAGRTGTIRGQNSLCLDLTGGVAADNTQVQMSGCAGTATQTWTLATDGTLQVEGKCALLAGDSSVHVYGCDSRGSAQWQASGQLLINAAGTACLTDPSGGSRPGTRVTVVACTGSAQQRWSLP